VLVCWAIYQAGKFLSQMSRGKAVEGPGHPFATRINESRVLLLLPVLFYILETRLTTRTNNPSSALFKWQLVEAFGLLPRSVISAVFLVRLFDTIYGC